MKWLLLCLSCTLSACSASNKVQHIASADAVIKYQDPEQKRFANLYPGKKSYPLTCSENCYPPSDQLRCQSPGEDCLFTGQPTDPKISTGFTLRWLGHASFYIQAEDGTNLLLDPVSKQFDWPVNWAFRLTEGFNRKPANWLNQAEIADTNAVLYSHIHYDHFNKDDIQQIGNSAQYFTPLGFAAHFPQGGYHINEMAWFSTQALNALKIHFVPAHHFSSRIWIPYLYEDDDKSLWGGWVIEQGDKRLFFAGDTGYSKHFKDIQQRYGDMDVCLLPIASYFHQEHGEWYRYVHTTPEDALVAADELNCKVMIPWGYGNSSWKMGDHSSHSALLRLFKMHKALNSSVPLYILNEGEEIKL